MVHLRFNGAHSLLAYDLAPLLLVPHNLMLLRPDGSPMVVFEFTSFGPDPTKIMQVTSDDAEYHEQLQQEEDAGDEGREMER